MTGFGSKLLYRAATGLEKAWADLDGDRLTQTPAELVRDIWDPEKCSLELLPYLAWALGVELWLDDWGETTKRQWIADQFIFKSLRGTKTGLAMAIDFAGRDVSPHGYTLDKITRRPQRVFSGPTLTKEQREAWLARLPQVREWRMHEQSMASPFKAFYGGSGPLRQRGRRFCLGGKGRPSVPVPSGFEWPSGFSPSGFEWPSGFSPSGFEWPSGFEIPSGFSPSPSTTTERRLIVAAPTPSIAKQHLQRRARWVVGGVETDVTVTEFGSYFQLHRSSEENGKVFSGRPFGLKRHYIPSDAWKRLITIQPESRLAWRSPVTPTLQAVISEPERVVVGWQPESGSQNWSVYSGIPISRKFFIPSTAPYRIYNRYPVLDPDVREYHQPSVQYMGTGMFGFPKFTVWADVSVKSQRSKWAAGSGYFIPRAKFWIPHDPTPIDRVRAATLASKSLRDKIMLRTGPRPRFVAGGVPILADVDTVIVGRP